jgi:LacI family transcriptional regulator
MAKPAPTHITLKEVAEACGLAVATVSYALRNHPKIPAETARRVQAAAAKLGYRPNPQVAALMAHVRRARPLEAGERLAFVWLTRHGSYPAMFQGARARAEQLGYALEEFDWAESGKRADRLQSILRARGITGVVLSPLLVRARLTLDWDWSHFSAAIIGNAEMSPELHHSGHHHFLGMRTALQRLQAQGCRRIAAVLDGEVDERARRGWSAAFLAHHPAPASARRWLLSVRPRATPRKKLRDWLTARRPDVVVTTTGMMRLAWPEEQLPTAGPQVVLLDWTPSTAGFAGIDQGEEVIAANAVDLVVGQLQRNERGVPEHVKMLLFPGRWREASGPAIVTGLGSKSSVKTP